MTEHWVGRTMSKWCEEKVELLKKLWIIDGHSAGVIARRIGMTRNSVIGKIFRLDLPKRASSINLRGDRQSNPHIPGPRTPRKRGLKKINFGRRHVPLTPGAEEAAVPELSWEPPHPFNPADFVPFIEIQPGQCRYIMDDKKNFCGQKTVPSYSWCLYHARIVFDLEATRRSRPHDRYN
jgi:GcrA cell cycle regulator